MEYTEDDFKQIHKVYQAARQAAVSFALQYMESSNEWYFTVDSPAKEERTVTKEGSLEFAVKYALEWLDGLVSKEGKE